LKLASLVHDFFPLLDPYDRPRQAFVEAFARDNRVLLEHSDVVIANSFFTRDCLVQLQNSAQLPPHHKLFVAQLAHECRAPEGGASAPLAHRQLGAHNDEGGGVDGYFLAVGCRPGRKNLQLILEAWLLLHAWSLADGGQRNLPNLVLAGATRGSIRRFVEQPRFAVLGSAIQWAASPTQAELVGLYQGAIATLLPSFSEGWGLPASESLWFGTPVVVSDTPVMHEVCGDLGLYVDPDQPEQLALQIRQLSEHKDVQDAQRLRIAMARPSLRRWMDTARDVCGALT
jgi:glycosyltransferase involved in cell wall biosynthesis